MFNLKKNTTAVLSISMFLVVLNCFVSSLGLYNNRTSPPLFVASLILTGLFIMLYIKNHSVIKLPCYVTIPIIFIGIAYGIAGVFYFVPPEKYEGGTLNTPGNAGLTEGIKFVKSQGEEKIFNDISLLYNYRYYILQ